MSNLSEFAILYVDDEPMSLKYFEKGFSEDFRILTASNADDAWEILNRHPGEIGLLMSDQRMPGQTGVQLLEKVRLNFPHVVRILVTAYSDVESAVAGINASAIYKYVGKPWDVTDLRLTLLRALEYYGVLRERDQLLREKLSAVQRILLGDRMRTLGVLASGLQCGFQNPLRGASAFAAALPPMAPPDTKPGPGHSSLASLAGDLAEEGSRAIFQIASELNEISDGPHFLNTPVTSLPRLLDCLINRDGSSAHPGLDVSIAAMEGIAPVRASPLQIPRLFKNLLKCLQAANPEAGSVRISAQETTVAGIGNAVEIVLSDNGVPWTAEQHRNLFSPFTKSQPSDDQSGLWLAVCFFITAHHGGRLQVVGKPEVRIRVTLPLDPTLVQTDSPSEGLFTGLFEHGQFPAAETTSVDENRPS
jgi:two-component system, probable response regulator PhcQ